MSGKKDNNDNDAIVIGAGPGGIQAAIYLGRYNRRVLLLDRSGGRTRHAVHVENYLGHPVISGRELIDIGLEQARNFGVEYLKTAVRKVEKDGYQFVVRTDESVYRSRFVIVSSGVRDNLPKMENFFRYFGKSVYNCIDCDGYRTTGKKLVVIGNSINAVRLAMGMREFYTRDITLLLLMYDPPDDVKEELEDEGIALIKGRPMALIGPEGSDWLEALELEDGRTIPCQCVMLNFGFKLNDEFLEGLPLKRDEKGFKYEVNHRFESSVDGLYILGPLNTEEVQIVIAAAEGALAAIDIKKRLLDL